MTDHSDLIERARAIAAYNGAGVHDDLRAAIRDLTDALSSQSLSLSEAREENDRKDTEIERLKGLVAGIRECPQETGSVEAVAWDIQGSKKWCGEHVVTRDPAIRGQWADTPERYGITIVPLYASPPDGGDTSLAEQVSRLRQALEDAQTALKPFAVVAEPIAHDAKDKWDPDGWIALMAKLTVGDFRRARMALENSKAGLADATNDPASSDLSSLRKGAEVMREALIAARKVMRNAWGAVTSDQVVDKQVDKMLRKGWEAPDAALVSGSREDGDA